jgi:hypothetical protein
MRSCTTRTHSKLYKTLRALARCDTIITKMAAEAVKAVVKAKEMETLSETALVAAKIG